MTTRKLVVVGASLAGLRAAEAARKLGFDGAITMIGAEPNLPYDRPPLSKGFLVANPGATTFRGADTLGSLEIDLHTGVTATGLDLASRTVHTDAGSFGYDGLVVATGVVARWPASLRGLAGVHTLRTAQDAQAIRAAFDAGARVLVVGAGFIGSEVASSARARGLSVTMVENLDTPLTRAVGRSMGAVLGALHLDHGTDLRCGTKLEKLEGNGKVERARLSDGSTLDVDLVVLGVGAVPATDWLASSGLTVHDGLVCDEYLSAGPQVYAAGDVARWPAAGGGSMRLEHWTNATEQAATAVRNWLSPDNRRPHVSVPYFWSDWYDSRIQFVGVAGSDEVRVISGSPAERKFAALYRQGDHVVGALTLNRPALIMKLRALVARHAGWTEAVSLHEVR